MSTQGNVNMMDGACLARVRMALRSGTSSGANIARLALKDPERVAGLSVNTLAEACGVSQSTVSRFCTTLGYSGFKAFQLDLATAAAHNSNEARLDDFVAGESIDKTVRRVFEGNRRTLTETERILDEKMLNRVARCIEHTNYIFVLGLGSSALIARYAAQRFTSLGLYAAAVDDPYDQLFATAAAKQGDVVIGISHSGSTGGVVEGLSTASKHGARTVALTNYEHSPLADVCEFKLITAFRENKISPALSSSYVGQMSVIDSLYFVLAGRRIKSASKMAQEVEVRAKRLLKDNKRKQPRIVADGRDWKNQREPQ